MDPPHAPYSGRSPRFPRPRGDGPDIPTLADGLWEVSPPTRGWTRNREPTRVVLVGFPAHAGMDPPARRRSPRISRFPRPRGDGPCRSVLDPGGRLVSPPTRGWTRFRPGARADARGFPAHAGMDRLHKRAGRPRARFPRPRGDGPAIVALAVRSAPVSPPTRGWTRYQTLTDCCGEGFPAHAGMDPLPATWCSAISGFPRPRGDGPPLGPVPDLHDGVSPPTRGWTVHRRGGRYVHHGFPAHAGMDPSLRSTSMT